jgi:hypothetical protein
MKLQYAAQPSIYSANLEQSKMLILEDKEDEETVRVRNCTWDQDRKTRKRVFPWHIVTLIAISL